MTAAKNKIGILITNLGTPDAPSVQALRAYLKEFLQDSRVVEIPKLLWWPILHGMILPLRPRYSAKLYQKIWTKKGSPLLLTTQAITEKLKQSLLKQYGDRIVITMGMRYGNPSIANGLDLLKKQKIERLIILPLYPQYAAATTGSTFDAVSNVLKTWRKVPALYFINGYHSHSLYINALVKRIEEYWQSHPPGEKLLFSFHGIPQRNSDRGDPYFHYCQQTAQWVAEKLQLSKERWQLVFQSRFGRTKWLQPYCDKTLVELAKQGTKSVDIICPGFAADCLETLEEIAITNRKIFLDAGGSIYHYIPALNTMPEHIELLYYILNENISCFNSK